ncbi:MAG: hypothetical protein LBB83_05315, partial [Treponema sp.]|nr:hypothetical protein [Treponema sp.]
MEFWGSSDPALLGKQTGGPKTPRDFAKQNPRVETNLTAGIDRGAGTAGTVLAKEFFYEEEQVDCIG